MNLTVHVGTTKTGTSSIQQFLNRNCGTLRANGYLVPSSLGSVIHLNAVMSSLPYGESPDLAKFLGVKDAGEHAAFRESTVAAFRNEVAAANDCREVLISAEYLHSRLPRREHVQTFRDLFCRDFDRVRIVVYVRPQIDQIVSLYSSVLRTGYARPLKDFIDSRMKPFFWPYFDLRDVITRWTDTFGTENVTVRPYKAITGPLGTVGDYCEFLGINPDASEWTFGRQANTSINRAGQELLLMLNQSGNLDGEMRRKVCKWTETHCPGRGAKPSPEQARTFQSLFDDSNAWVTETYFPDHPDYLQPSVSVGTD